MKWIAISYPFMILFMVIGFLNFHSWHEQSAYEFEQRQMDLQVNYSIDAAMQEMLANTTHIETDYIDWGKLELDPEIAWTAYRAVLMHNFGWSDTVTNRETIESCTPFFIVACYDGYYTYYHQPTKTITNPGGIRNQTYDLVWTPKLPYSYSEFIKYDMNGDGDTDDYSIDRDMWTAYAFNLDDDVYTEYSYNKAAGGYKYYTDRSLKDNIAMQNIKKRVIADTINNAANAALYSSLEGNTDVELFIPSEMSEWKETNPITRPTILTYLARNDGTTRFNINTFAIGGAKIDEAEYCVAYQRGGVHMYAYSKFRPNVESEGLVVEAIYASPQDAAKDGYYFDMKYFE